MLLSRHTRRQNIRVKRRQEEWDWPPPRRLRRRDDDGFEDDAPPPPRRTNRQAPPRKTDWASSPITTRIADAYFGFIWFVLKMAFAAFLGVVLYGSGWLFFQSVLLMH
jgi:hypothetical protein